MTSANDQQSALARAIELHSSGNLRGAEQQYRAILGTDPEQPDALHYLGVIGLQTGHFEAAVELLERAVRARPDAIDAIVNLGNGLTAVGRFSEAVEQLERALALGPPTATLLANLGGALAQLGRYADAVERYEGALAIEPGLAETRRSLADALVETGRPNDALVEIQKAIAAGPPSLPMQVSLGNILAATGRGEDAIRCFQEILANRPDIAPVRGNLANVLRQLGRLEEAIEHYEQVLELQPDHVETHHNLGLAYQDLGDKDAALAAYRKAVTLDPKAAQSWHGIAMVSKNAFDDDEVATLLELENAPDTMPEARMRLGFALGRFFENAGRYEESAGQYLLANPLRRAAFDYDIENDMHAFGNLKTRFDRAFFERWRDSGNPSDRPVFIVGMPRSGTTLVEQILASHPRVFGAGELTLLVRSIIDTFPMPDGFDYTAALADATAEDFQRIAGKYLGGLPDSDADRITDKLPHNFLNVGMIRALFPNAAIIHCRRDPRDTCFSIYKNLFGAYGHFYAYDLVELGRYYNAYRDLMAHWDAVLPGVVHTIDYEAMIDDQEGVTRRLLDACGLEWDPACLEFYKLDRPVATISASQVREPVYRGSIGAWRNYERMLEPLLEILNVGSHVRPGT